MMLGETERSAGDDLRSFLVSAIGLTDNKLKFYRTTLQAIDAGTMKLDGGDTQQLWALLMEEARGGIAWSAAFEQALASVSGGADTSGEA